MGIQDVVSSDRLKTPIMMHRYDLFLEKHVLSNVAIR